MAEETELQLLEAIHSGEQTALRRLYDRYSDHVMAVALRYMSNRDEASDVVQDSFVKILTSIGQFHYQGEGSLRAWISRIVSNMAKDHLRGHKRYASVENLKEEPAETFAFEMNELSPDVLKGMIGQLPANYRKVLNLFVYEGLSHKEIAQSLGVKESTSSSLYFRAKKMLARMIQHRLVAASLLLFVLGGAVVWWQLRQASPSVSGELVASETAKTGAVVAKDDVVADDEPQMVEPVEVVPVPSGKKEKTNVVAEVVQPEPHDGLADSVGTIAQTVPSVGDTVKRQSVPEEIQMAHAQQDDARQESVRQIVEHLGKSNTERLTVGLYSNNGIGLYSTQNSVRMTETMAHQYDGLYEQSTASTALSRSPIYLSDFEEEYTHKIPVSLGLTVSAPLGNRLSLVTGLVYTRQQSEFVQKMRSQRIVQQQTLHYIGIPVGLNYRAWDSKRFHTYFSLGLQADWNIRAELETEGVRQDMSRDRMLWSFKGGLGMQYDLLPSLGLYLEPSLTYTPDNGSRVQNYYKDKPLHLNLQLGLRLNLQR